MRSPNENNRSRQNQQNNRRGRNNNNNNNRRNNNNNNNSGKPQNMLTRNFDSNGPDVKIRGNAQTIADKYTSLAQDAISSGSRIMAENYFQHAEHYKRIVAVATAQQAEQKAAQQAKIEAQREQQEAQREAREQQQAAAREKNQAEAAAAQQAEAAPSMNNSDNAPVSLLDTPDAEPQPSQAEQLAKALEAPAIEPETVDEAPEPKPKRKRVTRPKRKPAVAKSEPADDAAPDAETAAPQASE